MVLEAVCGNGVERRAGSSRRAGGKEGAGVGSPCSAGLRPPDGAVGNGLKDEALPPFCGF